MDMGWMNYVTSPAKELLGWPSARVVWCAKPFFFLPGTKLGSFGLLKNGEKGMLDIMGQALVWS